MKNLYRLVFALFAMVAINLFTPNAALAQPARTQCQQLIDQLDCNNLSSANTAACQSLHTACASQDETIVRCVTQNGARLQRRGVHTISDIITFCATFAERPATPSRPRARPQRVFCPDYPGANNSLVSPRAENRCHGRVVDGVPVCDDGYVPVAAHAYVMRNGQVQEVQNNVLADRCVIDPRSPASQAQINQPIDPNSMCRQIGGAGVTDCDELARRWQAVYDCVTNPNTAECALAQQLRTLSSRVTVVENTLNNNVIPRIEALERRPGNINGSRVRVTLGVQVGILQQLPGTAMFSGQLQVGLRFPLNNAWTWEFHPLLSGGVGMPFDRVGPVLTGDLRLPFLARVTGSGTTGLWIGPSLGLGLSGKLWDEPRWVGANHSWRATVGGLLRGDVSENFYLLGGLSIGGGEQVVIGNSNVPTRPAGFIGEAFFGLGGAF